MIQQTIRHFNRIAITAIVLFTFSFHAVAGGESYDGDHHHRTLAVMTQNMDAGTDLKYLFAVPGTLDLLTAATLTYREVLNSKIPERAERLAKIIARTQPDLISLQEVTLWQTISGDQKASVLYDQIGLLLKALKKLNHPYKIAVSQTLSTGALPIAPSIIGRPTDNAAAIRFTDSDVIIARADLWRSGIKLSKPAKHIYKQLLSFPIGPVTLPSVRGWLSVDASVRGKTIRFVNTHLETVIPLIPASVFFQQAQAAELLSSLEKDRMPVVIAGDFNADAEFAGIGPDQTDTPKMVVAAGFTDVWDQLRPNNPGFTWPLFIEDPFAPNPIGPIERIDLIYERGLNARYVHRVGYLDKNFPSDHLGVLARLSLTDNRHHMDEGLQED